MRAKWAPSLLVSIGGCTPTSRSRGRPGIVGAGAGRRQHAATPAEAAGPIAAAGAAPARAATWSSRGETLSGVAERYRHADCRLAKANRVKPPFKVYAGQVLAIPATHAARRPARRQWSPPPGPIVVAPIELPPPRAAIRPVGGAGPDRAAVIRCRGSDRADNRRGLRGHAAARRRDAAAPFGRRLLVAGARPIASAFGTKPNGARNDGINIRAAEGTPVLAAENGIVVYAGDEIRGYGRMLLISHADGLTTAYAHNRRSGGGRRRGEPRPAGRHGRSDRRCHLAAAHFELRDGKEPIDPVAHLEIARTRIASAS